LRPNFVGIVGGIIAFASLALPWWTMTQTSSPAYPQIVSWSWNIYPYRISTSLFDVEVGQRLWFGWLSLALILVAGTLGIIGGIKQVRHILLAGGSCALFSIVVFVIGLQIELPAMAFMRESPKALFYFGKYGISPFNFSIYLSFGFWLALVSGILMLFASAMRTRMLDTGQRSASTRSFPSIERKYCTVCGAKLHAGDAYCRKCGAVIPS
jgi:hypothetical protein